ncbi:MAG: hypothetical protein Q7U52_11800 [Hydrogenophaga sp.]|nr:hypothetical protein [Hydrogenophaga sp.]
MSLALATRRARLLAVRGAIDNAGGGALHLHGGSMVANPETAAPAVALCVVPLAATSFALHATLAQLDLVPAQGFAASAGYVTWARYVDGAGTAVYDCTAGPPGSGAELIVTDGAVVPTAQVYTGGEINVTHTITEP